MAVERHLHVVETPVEGFDGEVTPSNLELLLRRITTLEHDLAEARAEVEARTRHESMQDRDLKGKRLRIAELEADREAKALDDPLRAEVELIHAAWKVACRRRRPLHFADRERISRAVKKLGLRRCLAAVAGAAYDPNRSKPRRNGHRETYNDLELVFREYANVARFAARVPDGWSPDPERLAAIVEPDADWIAERL